MRQLLLLILDESEIDIAKLETLKSNLISPRRLAISPIHMECKLYKIIDLPSLESNKYNGMVLGSSGYPYR